MTVFTIANMHLCFFDEMTNDSFKTTVCDKVTILALSREHHKCIINTIKISGETKK